MPTTPLAPDALEVRAHEGRDLDGQLSRLRAFVARDDRAPLAHDPAWLAVLREGLGHAPFCLEVARAGQPVGVLPLALVRSLAFGRFLVGLPYLNSGGVRADDPGVARALIDAAVALADRLAVRHLELRHERAVDHPALGHRLTTKALMRRPLPATAGALWDALHSKVRNQVRKGQKSGLEVAWGGDDLLPEFYDVFSRNMRDLGTPVYGRRLFRAVLRHFPDRAELCVVRGGGRAVAAALLLHGRGVTEVPSASSLREANKTNCNMLMYWHMLERAVHRGQAEFDFGRSTVGGNTYRFKEQWGGRPEPAEWQYSLRSGQPSDMRPDSPRYRRMIRIWQRLPVSLTRLIGPPIVRGIP